MTKETSFLCLLTLTSLLFCSTHQVRLTVSPSRSQFFELESVTLICEDENSSAGWTVRRKIGQNQFKCGDGWGKPAGLSCSISYVLEKDSGVYWCESMSGSSSSSSSIQLSVSGGSVILQSPVLPVMEGDDVILRCHDKTLSDLPAAFFKDGVFIGNESSGNFTLLHVSSSDEGLYKCSISGQGESPSSRISVRDKPTVAPPTSASKAPPPASNPLQLEFTVMRHLLVFCPYIISTLLFLSLYQHRSQG